MASWLETHSKLWATRTVVKNLLVFVAHHEQIPRCAQDDSIGLTFSSPLRGDEGAIATGVVKAEDAQ